VSNHSTEFLLSIITPEGRLFESNAVQVNLPGLEGNFGVLQGHMNMIASIKPGLATVFEHGDKTAKFIAVFDGIAEITPTTCDVLVEKGAYPEDMKKSEVEELIKLESAEFEKAETEVAKASATKNLEYLQSILSLK